MAIYDVMQHVEPDVSTICVGMGMSAAAMILSGGAAGKRFALPNARIMIHQGSAGTRGAPSDMEIQLREVLSLTRRMAEIIAHHSGRPVEQVAVDIDRDHYMTAAEARDYGIIDDIIMPAPGPVRTGGRRPSASAARERRTADRRSLTVRSTARAGLVEGSPPRRTTLGRAHKVCDTAVRDWRHARAHGEDRGCAPKT